MPEKIRLTEGNTTAIFRTSKCDSVTPENFTDVDLLRTVCYSHVLCPRDGAAFTNLCRNTCLTATLIIRFLYSRFTCYQVNHKIQSVFIAVMRLVNLDNCLLDYITVKSHPNFITKFLLACVNKHSMCMNPVNRKQSTTTHYAHTASPDQVLANVNGFVCNYIIPVPSLSESTDTLVAFVVVFVVIALCQPGPISGQFCELIGWEHKEPIVPL
ncbi:hypothetical protein CSKR_103315 [Clonorchis sinensis]|uniref:Uncharacterized protein n=1 Tax=Clonorchis sinensis TaxID=79923 RepID=A0A3R7D0Q0_CLOSI|nr:hypothetical protein CSKR_103315 [Clonorchis sinensis]